MTIEKSGEERKKKERKERTGKNALEALSLFERFTSIHIFRVTRETDTFIMPEPCQVWFDDGCNQLVEMGTCEAFVINLQRRGDKRERALCNLDFLMPAQIFAAVDGAALERRNGIKRTIGDVCHLYWDGKHKREHHIVKGVHNAETAWATLRCMRSHQQVLSLPFGDKSFRMILEDDILHPWA